LEKVFPQFFMHGKIQFSSQNEFSKETYLKGLCEEGWKMQRSSEHMGPLQHIPKLILIQAIRGLLIVAFFFSVYSIT